MSESFTVATHDLRRLARELGGASADVASLRVDLNAAGNACGDRNLAAAFHDLHGQLVTWQRDLADLVGELGRRFERAADSYEANEQALAAAFGV